MLAEAQYSERRFQFKGDGGTSTNIASIRRLSATCACTSTTRRISMRPTRRIATTGSSPANITNLLESRPAGTKPSTATSSSAASGRAAIRSRPTGYVFNADFLTDAAGTPVLDSTGRPIPVFVPGESYLEYYPAITGATMNTDNHSVFVQDHWTINDRWSADLGARFEQVNAVSTGDIMSIDAGRIVPRLAAAYDVNGDGNHIVHFTYGQYSGRYNEALIGANSPVGNPAEISADLPGPGRSGLRLRAGIRISPTIRLPPRTRRSPIRCRTSSWRTGVRSPLVHEFCTVVRRESVRRPRIRGGELHLPQDRRA